MYHAKKRPKPITDARLKRLSGTLPGLVVEQLPSGARRIRVRDITDPGAAPQSHPICRRSLHGGIPEHAEWVGHNRSSSAFDELQEKKGFSRAIGDMLTGARTRSILRGCECSIAVKTLLKGSATN